MVYTSQDKMLVKHFNNNNKGHDNDDMFIIIMLYNGHCIDSMEMGVLIIFQITAHLWPDFDQIFYL